MYDFVMELAQITSDAHYFSIKQNIEKLACVAGGMRKRASGGAAIFHRGPRE